MTTFLNPELNEWLPELETAIVGLHQAIYDTDLDEHGTRMMPEEAAQLMARFIDQARKQLTEQWIESALAEIRAEAHERQKPILDTVIEAQRQRMLERGFETPGLTVDTFLFPPAEPGQRLFEKPRPVEPIYPKFRELSEAQLLFERENEKRESSNDPANPRDRQARCDDLDAPGPGVNPVWFDKHSFTPIDKVPPMERNKMLYGTFDPVDPFDEEIERQERRDMELARVTNGLHRLQHPEDSLIDDLRIGVSPEAQRELDQLNLAIENLERMNIHGASGVPASKLTPRIFPFPPENIQIAPIPEDPHLQEGEEDDD